MKESASCQMKIKRWGTEGRKDIGIYKIGERAKRRSGWSTVSRLAQKSFSQSGGWWETKSLKKTLWKVVRQMWTTAAITFPNRNLCQWHSTNSPQVHTPNVPLFLTTCAQRAQQLNFIQHKSECVFATIWWCVGVYNADTQCQVRS